MLRLIRSALILALVPVLVLIATPAHAGSPHFIKSAFEVSISGDTITVSGKEAGLGNVPSVHIVLVAEASCINGGQKNPNAANKDSFDAAGDFPVFNGKAEFELSVTAAFQPDCSPPMTLQWTRITVTDTDNNVSATIRL
jgi:hypothetical protein